ncbi:aminotransferase class V-fold PLP-dependent enzyme [Mycoplasmopsis opalescens]|uniref:aminotransferase class V-fold PLP-dependent enzyme n=1 Tax=Mycoplasmopsis opalescens TaxID=114886 RepID=UPI0004A74351
MYKLRKFFPMADKITYLDSAALMLKPIQAIEASNDFYSNNSVSIRTINSPLGIKNYELIKLVKSKIRKLVNASDDDKVIFTSGTTESLNSLARSMSSLIKNDDNIIIDAQNHSSNFIPWIELAKRKNAKTLVKQGVLDSINANTKIVAISQLTNNLSHNNNIKDIYKVAKKHNTFIINDAAQAIVYEPVDMNYCDAIAFSCNKFYGPTGLGVLVIKKELFDQIKPSSFGGGSVTHISEDNDYSLTTGESAFESGTPNFAGIWMFNAALDFFNEYLGYEKSNSILKELSHYAFTKLSSLKNVEIYTKDYEHIILINVKNVDSHDVAHYLGTKNIYVRSGIFCAHYLKNLYAPNSYIRISLAVYNNFEDIDKLVYALENGGDFLVI